MERSLAPQVVHTQKGLYWLTHYAGRSYSMATNPDKLIRVAQVAEITGLDAKTIYAGGCDTDRILRIKISRRCTLFSYQSVNEFVEWLKGKAMAEAAEREGNARTAKIILLRKPQLQKQTVNRLLRKGATR